MYVFGVTMSIPCALNKPYGEAVECEHVELHMPNVAEVKDTTEPYKAASRTVMGRNSSRQDLTIQGHDMQIRTSHLPELKLYP